MASAAASSVRVVRPKKRARDPSSSSSTSRFPLPSNAPHSIEPLPHAAQRAASLARLEGFFAQLPPAGAHGGLPPSSAASPLELAARDVVVAGGGTAVFSASSSSAGGAQQQLADPAASFALPRHLRRRTTGHQRRTVPMARRLKAGQTSSAAAAAAASAAVAAAGRPREYRRKPSLLRAEWEQASTAAIGLAVGLPPLPPPPPPPSSSPSPSSHTPTPHPATLRLPTHAWHAKRFLMERRPLGGVHGAAASSAPPGPDVCVAVARRDAAPSAALRWGRESCVALDASHTLALALEGKKEEIVRVLRAVLSSGAFAGQDGDADEDEEGGGDDDDVGERKDGDDADGDAEIASAPAPASAAPGPDGGSTRLSRSQRARRRRADARKGWRASTPSSPSAESAGASAAAAAPFTTGRVASHPQATLHAPHAFPDKALAPATVVWLPRGTAVGGAASHDARRALVLLPAEALTAAVDALRAAIREGPPARHVTLTLLGSGGGAPPRLALFRLRGPKTAEALAALLLAAAPPFHAPPATDGTPIVAYARAPLRDEGGVQVQGAAAVAVDTPSSIAAALFVGASIGRVGTAAAASEDARAAAAAATTAAVAAGTAAPADDPFAADFVPLSGAAAGVPPLPKRARRAEAEAGDTDEAEDGQDDGLSASSPYVNVPVMLLGHLSSPAPSQGPLVACDVLLPSRFARAAWVRLVTAGHGHAVGEREWEALAALSGEPVFPRDFPECAAAHAALWSARREGAEQAARVRGVAKSAPFLALRALAPHAPAWGLLWPELGTRSGGEETSVRVVRQTAFSSAFWAVPEGGAVEEGEEGKGEGDEGGTGPHAARDGEAHDDLLLSRLRTTAYLVPPRSVLTASPTLLPVRIRMTGRGVPEAAAGLYAPTPGDMAAWRAAIADFRTAGAAAGARPAFASTASSSTTAAAVAAAASGPSSSLGAALAALTTRQRRWWLGVEEAPLVVAPPRGAAGAPGAASADVEAEATGPSAGADGGGSSDLPAPPAPPPPPPPPFSLAAHHSAVVAADAFPSRQLVGFVTGGALNEATARGCGYGFVRAEYAAALVSAGCVTGAGGARKGDGEEGEEGGEGRRPHIMVLLRNPGSAHYRPALLALAGV